MSTSVANANIIFFSKLVFGLSMLVSFGILYICRGFQFIPADIVNGTVAAAGMTSTTMMPFVIIKNAVIAFRR